MKWKKISILFSTIFLFIIVCFCMQEHDAVNTVRLVAQAEDHITQSVSLYYDDGVYYAFLPSYADTNSLSIVYNNAYSLYLDGEYYDSDSQFSTFEPN